jgi:DNA-binding transcriptional LysR family regulator
MSLVQLQYFVAIAEEGSLGRAAERLHISQPPLTRQLRSLEDELGAPLFERTPKGVRLLPTGAAFLSHTRRILADLDAAVASVRQSSNEPEERLDLGHEHTGGGR